MDLWHNALESLLNSGTDAIEILRVSRKAASAADMRDLVFVDIL